MQGMMLPAANGTAPILQQQLVKWSSRNNVNYMEAGVFGSLSYASNNAKQLLRNFYQKGVNNIRKGKEEKPRAFVISKEQNDPLMAAYLVNQLRGQGIEVHKAESGANKGDYVVLLDQPYRNLAVSLLTKQNYPKEAKFPPYDDIAWTLGYLYGVDVKTEDSVKYALSDLTLLTADATYTGKLNGEGTTYVLNYKAQNTVLPALYWIKSQNKKVKTIVLDSASTLDGIKDTLKAGSIIFKGLTNDQAKKINSQFGLDLISANANTTAQNNMK